MRLLTALLLSWLCALPLTAWAQSAPEITGDEARRVLRILKRALVELHPGLTRYTTLEQIDAEFVAAEAAVAQGSSRAAMYLLASRIAASVQCGHTWANRANQRQDVVRNVFNRSDKLPLTLRFVEGRALVTGSTVPGLEAGAELLAVDGRAISDISAALVPYGRADGRHDGAQAKRHLQLDSGPLGGAMDRLFPLLFAPQDGAYRLLVRGPGDAASREMRVAAVPLAERNQALPPPADTWTLRVDGDTALLTLPSFAFWRSEFKPDEFLARSFEALREVPYLVVDIRRNEGGDDAVGRRVLSHLLQAPFQTPAFRVESAYERAPYALARYLDTWDFGFFDRTGQVTPSPDRRWRLADQPGRRIEPVAAPYRGRVVLLVGPQNSSAGFFFARDMKASGAATLVGQPTAGNLRGLNSGQLAWITLPASGVSVDIPLLAALAPNGTPDAGVVPHVLVPPRWDAALAGTDAELAAARELIGRWRPEAPRAAVR